MRTTPAAWFLLLTALSAAATEPGQPPAQEPTDYWSGDIHAPVPATLRGGRVLHAQELQRLIARGDVAIVDVSSAPKRPQGMAPDAPWLPVAHKAIPGAHWIPGGGLATPTPAFDEFFHARLAAATRGDVDMPVVVYCHERCWLSWNGAKRVLSYGYKKVYWFPEGIEGWTAAQLPTAAADEEKPDDP